MVTKLEDFDGTLVKELSLMFDDDVKSNIACVGTIGVETETTEKTKMCQGRKIKSTMYVSAATLTISAHLPTDVARRVFGLTNEGLKTGVYALKSTSVGAPFAVTAVILDEFTQEEKLLALPVVSNTTGLTFTVDSDATEVAYIELSLAVTEDAYGASYYEGYVSEMDEATATAWKTNFDPVDLQLVAPTP